MARPISERIGNNKEEFYLQMMENLSNSLRVSIPGIIHDFDPVTQTASVQVAIREKIFDDNLEQHWVDLPLLLDVPIVLPRAGGYVLTLPISQGDECLVIFGDMCIDAWFASGGIQNQMEKRRHDLSDAFAILGVSSQPNVLPNYSTTAAQLRTIDRSAYISLSGNEIDLVASKVKINGIVFNTHTHTALAAARQAGRAKEASSLKYRKLVNGDYSFGYNANIFNYVTVIAAVSLENKHSFIRFVH